MRSARRRQCLRRGRVLSAAASRVSWALLRRRDQSSGLVGRVFGGCGAAWGWHIWKSGLRDVRACGTGCTPDFSWQRVCAPLALSPAALRCQTRASSAHLPMRAAEDDPEIEAKRAASAAAAWGGAPQTAGAAAAAPTTPNVPQQLDQPAPASAAAPAAGKVGARPEQLLPLVHACYPLAVSLGRLSCMTIAPATWLHLRNGSANLADLE